MFVNVNDLFLELVSLRDKNECGPHLPGSIAVPFRGLFKIFDDHPLPFMGVPPGWGAPLVNVFLPLSSPPFTVRLLQPRPPRKFSYKLANSVRVS